ncbi:MAG: ATP-binding protein [Rhodothermales bacterium]
MLRRPLPISLRLTLWYSLTLFLLLSAFAAFCYTGFHVALHRDFDRHLTHEQRELLPFVAVDAAGPHFEGLDELTSVAYQSEGVYGTYVRLLTPEGEVRYRSPNFEAYPSLPVALPGQAEETSASIVWDGLPARTRTVPLRRGDDGPVLGWLELTGFEWSLHRELHRLAVTLALGVLLGVGFALGAGWWLARRTLRPISTMTEAAGQMGARDLSARLPADFGPRDELTDLAETFNGLLDRLERSVERERRFTANAAHELLTPLATLRSEAEVALRRDREAPDYRDALRRLLLDIERMTATVQGLLQLARADTLTKRAEDRLDLSALVEDRLFRARPIAEAKGLALHGDVAPGVVIAAQASPIAEVADNLLANAVKYTPEGGRVDVRLSHGDGAARFVVRDNGVGFSPEEAARLFDRFYRSDDAAVQSEPGSGLGLAIVRAIAEGYGGHVHAQSPGVGEGAEFEVVLPCLACRPRSGAASEP